MALTTSDTTSARLGVGVGVGDGTGVAVGVGEGVAVGVAVGVSVGAIHGVAVAVAVGDGVGVAIDTLVGVTVGRDVAEGRAAATARRTTSPMSGVGSAGGVEPHAAASTVAAGNATAMSHWRGENKPTLTGPHLFKSPGR